MCVFRGIKVAIVSLGRKEGGGRKGGRKEGRGREGKGFFLRGRAEMLVKWVLRNC